MENKNDKPIPIIVFIFLMLVTGFLGFYLGNVLIPTSNIGDQQVSIKYPDEEDPCYVLYPAGKTAPLGSKYYTLDNAYKALGGQGGEIMEYPTCPDIYVISSGTVTLNNGHFEK